METLKNDFFSIFFRSQVDFSPSTHYIIRLVPPVLILLWDWEQVEQRVE